jgi:hypothetical protein
MTPTVYTAEQRLLDLGLAQPPASGPAGNCVPLTVRATVECTLD